MKNNEKNLGARLFAAFLAGVMILGSVAAALIYIFN
jgi:hypothetical protein